MSRQHKRSNSPWAHLSHSSLKHSSVKPCEHSAPYAPACAIVRFTSISRPGLAGQFCPEVPSFTLASFLAFHSSSFDLYCLPLLLLLEACCLDGVGNPPSNSLSTLPFFKPPLTLYLSIFQPLSLDALFPLTQPTAGQTQLPHGTNLNLPAPTTLSLYTKTKWRFSQQNTWLGRATSFSMFFVDSTSLL